MKALGDDYDIRQDREKPRLLSWLLMEMTSVTTPSSMPPRQHALSALPTSVSEPSSAGAIKAETHGGQSANGRKPSDRWN